MIRLKSFKTKVLLLSLLLCVLFSGCADIRTTYLPDPSDGSSDTSVRDDETYTYTDEQIYNKLLGGWTGQMAGVVYGANAEFQYCGEIMPETDVVDFSELNINDAFWQDDLYVEMTFLEVMAQNGFECSIDLLGNAFAKSAYPLDHANKQARDNLNNGIAPKLCGHYDNNLHCDDIDWQIESDFIGLICGGDPQKAADRAYEIGHMICYGDGVYGGVFVATLTASAFTCDDIETVVQTALGAIPDDTEFKSVMELVVSGYENGLSWDENWAAVESAWGKDDRCVSYYPYSLNIDAKLNSAYVLMGLLYGEGDFEKSLTIALRCGQDNDCNPSTVGGVLGVMLGYDKIPDKYKVGLDINSTKFSYTNYTLKNAVDTTAQLFKSRLSKNDDDIWEIKRTLVSPVPYEQWAEAPSVVFSATEDKDKVKINMTAYSVAGIADKFIDFGDGFVTHENVAGYRYQTDGDYTIVCTVTDVLGNSTVVEQTVHITDTESQSERQYGVYRNIAAESVPVCSDSLPTGSGSKDIYVISDGITGGGNTLQYDTYCGYFGAHDEYIGYLFKTECVIDKIIFTEGMHFDNGGWFADGTLKIQLLTNGVWTDVEFCAASEYPDGNTQNVFGAGFETYEFSFEKVNCDGVRLIGTAGGDAGFISVSEFAVMGAETVTE